MQRAMKSEWPPPTQLITKSP